MAAGRTTTSALEWAIPLVSASTTRMERHPCSQIVMVSLEQRCYFVVFAI